MKVAGTYSPPISFENDEIELNKINTILLNVDMSFVDMGVPKQGRFIYENMHKYQIPISFSIDGTIDFIAGRQKRALKWMGKIGVEWLYRLCQDPKHMFRRYIIDDTKIIGLAWKYRKVKQ